MTTFYTGSKQPTVLNDDIVVDAKPEDCTKPCWAVTGDPNALNIDLSILDQFTNQQLQDWIGSNNKGLTFPVYPYAPEEAIVIPELISGIDESNATTTIYTNHDEATAAYDEFYKKMDSFNLEIADYIDNRNFDSDTSNLLYQALTLFILNNDSGAAMAEIPNCQDERGNKCKEDDELIDLVLLDYCVTDINEGVIKCIKRSQNYGGDPDTTKEIDNCLDCKGYMVCCDNGIPRLVIAQPILAANEITNCVFYKNQKDAIDALREARQVTGYYRELELINGTYLCRKGYEYCHSPVYDDYYECRNVTRPPEQLDPPLPSLNQVLQ